MFAFKFLLIVLALVSFGWMAFTTIRWEGTDPVGVRRPFRLALAVLLFISGPRSAPRWSRP